MVRDKHANKKRGITAGFALFPAEIIVAIFGSLTFLLYAVLAMPLRSPSLLYFRRLHLYVLFYLLGLVFALLISRMFDLEIWRTSKRHISWKMTLQQYRTSYLRARSVVNDLRILNCVALMFFFFVQLKHLIPSVNPSVYDEVLLKSDLLIFFGQTSWEQLQNIIGFKYAEFLSAGYVVFYYYTLLLVLIFTLQRNVSLRQEFFSSFVFLWLLGILIVYAFPTLGPCFYIPGSFVDLPATRMTEMQAWLWDNKLMLDQFPRNEKGIYAISGFPSLHLAVPILGALYFKRLSRLLAWLSWLFVVLTVITTLYFGWHYFLDDVGSFLLVFLVMGLTRFIFNRGVFGSKQALANT